MPAAVVEAIARAAHESILVINPLIYAEVPSGYSSIEEIELILPLDQFRRDPLPYEAAFLAGKAFLAYRRRGGIKTSPLSDFYIGTHAAIAGFRLLTRDTPPLSNVLPEARSSRAVTRRHTRE